MTMWASRTDQRITIHSSFGVGPVFHKYEVNEPVSDVKYFWGQLGGLIQEAEAEAEEEAQEAAAAAKALAEEAEEALTEEGLSGS